MDLAEQTQQYYGIYLQQLKEYHNAKYKNSSISRGKYKWQPQIHNYNN